MKFELLVEVAGLAESPRYVRRVDLAGVGYQALIGELTDSSAPSNSNLLEAAESVTAIASGQCSTIERTMSRWLSSTPKTRCFLTLVPIAT